MHVPHIHIYPHICVIILTSAENRITPQNQCEHLPITASKSHLKKPGLLEKSLYYAKATLSCIKVRKCTNNYWDITNASSQLEGAPSG